MTKKTYDSSGTGSLATLSLRCIPVETDVCKTELWFYGHLCALFPWVTERRFWRIDCSRYFLIFFSFSPFPFLIVFTYKFLFTKRNLKLWCGNCRFYSCLLSPSSRHGQYTRYMGAVSSLSSSLSKTPFRSFGGWVQKIFPCVFLCICGYAYSTVVAFFVFIWFFSLLLFLSPLILGSNLASDGRVLSQKYIHSLILSYS